MFRVNLIERFSFECWKVIGFAFTTLRDWLKKLAPLFHPTWSKTKTNRNSLVRVFPPFASATCNYFVFWLVHLIICVLCDWLEWLLWFWLYDTKLKTALPLLQTSPWSSIYSRSRSKRSNLASFTALIASSTLSAVYGTAVPKELVKVCCIVWSAPAIFWRSHQKIKI